jgi:hypothetical protein
MLSTSGSAAPNLLNYESQLFLKFNYGKSLKIKNKPDPALLRTSYLDNEIKTITPKSCETILLTDDQPYCLVYIMGSGF